MFGNCRDLGTVRGNSTIGAHRDQGPRQSSVLENYGAITMRQLVGAALTAAHKREAILCQELSLRK